MVAWELLSNDAKRTILSPNAKHSTLPQGCFLCKAIADAGGYTIVQDPATADVPTMPQAALRLLKPDAILSPQGIITFLKSIS